AAVCVMARPADEAWMKDVAREMNLSETAFLFPEGDGWRLRWLTPTVEVSLCGHATLASAHVLWETGRLAPQATARFYTLSGVLTARREHEWIVMDFPARAVDACAAPEGLEAALGAEPRWVGSGPSGLLVELASAETVRRLAPDMRAVAALPQRAVTVTAAGDGAPVDFVSRFFAP